MTREQAQELLLKYARGEARHSFSGKCPDLDDTDTRDPECPLCCAIDVLAAPSQPEGAPTPEQIREWRHKAGQYDSIVKAVEAADGGKYRADTISALLSRLRDQQEGAEPVAWLTPVDLRRVQDGRTAFVRPMSEQAKNRNLVYLHPSQSAGALPEAVLAEAREIATGHPSKDARAFAESVIQWAGAAAPDANLLCMTLACIRWNSFGECRTEGWPGVPPSPSETAEAIERHLRAAAPDEGEARRLQHDTDSKELRSLCQARDEARRERDLLKVEVAALESSVGHLSRLVDDLRPGHDRYQYLRERPLDAIDTGGVFAGLVPDNVVLNGEDLDRAVDAALSAPNGEEPSHG